ncbi:MAG: glycine--tRNA ligase [Candidatus Levybacteria bacterium CG_4_9_14_3_um_filter_35_16]|nr:MAG: glycine--tRNA ligase [Candidatus Levybacteria bacterium CG22_combo_CG10-13_8_21_14_all_35_11]PJA00541.1 MAG: glycine--tRNA ligase [Candidatus Levybacteria bacterium CG_4_10_14_0_2_um_filter_35_8]PJA91283.1 MAG: glycine--tRNA ligase [Candidatus Levybacteria bacterium CG_4_9_14_3_um_filter_35_16]PJC54313.1 MAG: glycine--tRNA ligase [Candidatus Levybacteria bacterium CG_4_9_14_0_2_um_filter_35_21]
MFMEDLMEKITNLAKKRGFVFPDSEIYGGLANTWDFGPLGIELKNNIKKLWWKTFVQERMDMVGLDSAIIMNPKVWEASGHVSGFTDQLVDCKSCKNRLRADHLVEDATGIDVEGKSPKEVLEIINKNKVKCPTCGKIDWTEPRNFNLLFKTQIGVLDDAKSLAYLRGETAQGMFADFKLILATSRKKIPFGIAQIGKAFRNEVTPGNFIFRTREFEIAEFEYFISPKADWQKIFDEWLGIMQKFADKIGLDKNKLHLHEIPTEKRAHYSKRTVDLEYDFPFGQKELWGIAYRTDYDLSAHQKHSSKDMKYFDQETHEAYIPHVIEPTFGVERTLLATLVAAYNEEEVSTATGEKETRIVLKLPKELAPFKIAILPLSKKPELEKIAQDIFDSFKESYMVDYDVSQSIGKRYRRQDEIGTPYCITVDFETLEDKTVTVRDRDTMKQERIKITKLPEYFSKNL